VATTGISSLSSPVLAPALYTLSDVAEVFVQCLCTPDFLVTTADPWARLAAMQTMYLSPYCDLVFGRALGAFGATAAQTQVDLVQSLFEYHGDTFHAEFTYAWWRYASYQGASFASHPLASAPPAAATQVLSVTGPFYARDSCNVWTALSHTPNAGSASDLAYDASSPSGRMQINVAYAWYALAQMRFPDAPLCAQNPCGGRWPYLGTYNVGNGLVESVTRVIWGPPLGRLFPSQVVVGARLPPSLPHVIGSPPVAFTHPFFVVTGASNDGTTAANYAGDPSAPPTVVFNGQWLVYDPTTSPVYTVTEPWPVNFAASSGRTFSATVAELPYMKTVYDASCLWDRTVPPSAAGLQYAEGGQAWMASG
jgi:hypothetical protein